MTSTPTPAGGPSAPLRPQLLLGADVGGTATRVGVATLAGEVLGIVTGPAGNPVSVGLETSARRIRAAAEQCLAELDGSLAGRPGTASLDIGTAVVGLAGGGLAGEGFLSAALPAVAGPAPRLVSDLSVAFSSATPAAEGYVLVAGTGAVAGRIHDGDLRERRDGWGWLLGDDGSGFWLGREAVRATLGRLQAGQPLGPLGRAVVERSGTADPVDLVQRCYARAPVWLATLGELVSRHPDDPDAQAIATQAAAHLHQTLVGLAPQPGLPVVLAGSVVTRPGPVRDALVRRLTHDLANPVLTAESGVVGALWLAVRRLGLSDPAIHARLAGSAPRTSGSVV